MEADSDRGGNKAADIAAQLNHFFYEAGTNERISFGRHEKDRLDLAFKPAVHERHLQFIFIIRYGANTAENHARAAALCVRDQQPFEAVYFNVAHVRQNLPYHLDTLLDGEQRLLARVVQDSHNQMIEEAGSSLDQIKGTVCDGIER